MSVYAEGSPKLQLWILSYGPKVVNQVERNDPLEAAFKTTLRATQLLSSSSYI